MVDINDMIERIANNIGCDNDTLNARLETVLGENRNAWMDSGKTEEACKVNALRIAGRQIKSERDRLKRSGATLYEGMFISVPRYKDWAEFAYKKAAKTIAEGNDVVNDTLVETGKATLYMDNNDGTFTKKYNPSLARKASLEEGMAETELSALPKDTYPAGNGMHFHLVWDSNSPTFPSGDDNWKYGSARPLSEKDRTSMFLGRPVDGGDVEVLSFRMNGALAELEFPTFTTGTIAGRPARNGNTIYGKVGATNFQESDSVQSIFSDSPDALLSSVEGIKILENGLQDIESFMGTLSDKEKWDALVAVQTEVIHIDPRDKGGYVITVGDLDIMSIAGTVDIYVPESQESNVDFGVGSTLLCVGSPWMSREGEARLSVTGWWCAESLTASSTSASNEAEGWD